MPKSSSSNSPTAKRPESSLLLACARTRLDAEHAERIRALTSEGLDWAWLLQAAARHRTAPLLYHSLSSVSGDAVPQDAMQVLRTHFKANAVRNLVLTKHLIQALRTLQGNGVTAIPFKGPALAEFAYGDLSLRQFSDLDILIQRRDISRATDALAAMGYRLVLESGVPEEAYLQSMHHYTFVRDDVDAILELHWRISERYFDSSPVSERLWHRLEPAALAGAPVQRMSDEDLLLFLCLHGAKHGWECLAQVCDIAELARARAGHMDWQQALAAASILGFKRLLLLGLSLANTLLGASLPPEISENLQDDSAVRLLVSQIQASIFQEADIPSQSGESERFRFFRLHLRMRERFRDKLLHCLRVALVPSQEDWAFVSLPLKLSFLYYLLRPLRLLAKHAAKALGKPRRR